MHHPQRSPHSRFDDAAVEAFLDHLARLLARDHLRRSVDDSAGIHHQRRAPRHVKVGEDRGG